MKKKTSSTIRTGVHMHSGLISGPVRIVHPAIQRLGIPWMYDHRRHAYLVARQHLADVEAALVADGHQVELTLGGSP
ncbi:MAG: hypothetical protein ACJ74U_20105 [Jatrophihabitantaceae bacterium]